MSEVAKVSIKGLTRRLERDALRLRIRGDKALDRVASKAVRPIRQRAPKAFGDLQGSVHAVPGKTVVDAPHAGAVEVGSRPHVPNLEALTAWVRLRGTQGLTDRGRMRRAFSKTMGPTTPYQARRVAGMLRAQVKNGAAPIDAPEQVAKAIAAGIEKHGTPPHWYVRNSLDDIAHILDREVRSALGK